ncbi:GntR family transcriptional regulator [Curtobacterium sp. MCBD17_013]|nr:GntR family transcriptional regulator [Curtobacterium sp. MCBD17_028]PZF60048.1 GntR family transcriptional regulator [Curtobacterium sp. MCBD17_013]
MGVPPRAARQHRPRPDPRGRALRRGGGGGRAVSGTGHLVAIDAGGRVPPYEQVRSQIAAQIAAGYLVDGERLPSVRGLAGELRLAPGTVAKAYGLLEEAGLVTTARGGGTRVVRPAAVPEAVDAAARVLAEQARHDGLSFDQTVAALRDRWQD